MPVIDFGEMHTLSSTSGWDHLYAVMAYPNDLAAREELLTKFHARELAQIERFKGRMRAGDDLLRWHETFVYRALAADGGFAALARGPSIDDAMKHWRTRSVRGQMAGDLLLFWLQPSYTVERPPRRPLAGPSREQAVHVLLCRFSRLDHRSDRGRRLPGDRRSLLGAWSHFRSVSHLWGAWRLRVYRRPDPLTLREFLATSEILRERAEDAGILKADEVWHPAENLELPAVKVDIPPISNWVESVLEHYQRPNRG